MKSNVNSIVIIPFMDMDIWYDIENRSYLKSLKLTISIWKHP